MSSRPVMRLVAALVPAAALLLPATAHAEKVVTEDPVGDASQVSIMFTEESDELVVTPAPDETATDITRTVVAHGRTRLAVTVHVRDLVLSTAPEAYLRVATPRGAFQMSVTKVPGSRARVRLERKNGRVVECRALRAALDGDTNTVSVSLPTSCVGDPRWVQVGVGIVRVSEPTTHPEAPGALVVFADDGHRDGDIRENDVAKGPRVHRG